MPINKDIIRITITIVTALLAVFLSITPVSAHPGRTAADGCHYCRTNCDYWGVPWNQRHCHGGSTYTPPTSAPKYIYSPISTPRPTIIIRPNQNTQVSNSIWENLVSLINNLFNIN